MKNTNQTLFVFAACFMMLMAFTTPLSGQVPESFNYQAILRDATGAVKANTAVSLEIDILKGNPEGTNVFSEIHNVTTNSSGLIILQVGSLNTTDFADVNWSEGPYFLKVTADGMDMGTTRLLSVPYALHAKTVEVDHVNDADADPENELQTLDISGTMLTLSNGGGSVTLPSAGGGDNWGTQVAMTDATLAGNGTSGSPLKIAQNGAASGQFLKWNGSAWAPGTGSDADADPANELQTLNISGTSLTLSNGGGTVTLPSSGGGDNWGTQTAMTDATLTGNGTAGSPLKIAQNGATSGQFLKWNGSAWAPGASGSDNWGTQTAVTDATLTGNGTAATPLKIAQNGAISGQVLKWNGSAWAPDKELDLPYYSAITSNQSSFYIDNYGNGSGIVGNSVSGSGVKGWSTYGCGVYGNTVGDSVGVYGHASTRTSKGVLGLSSVYGVYGISIGSKGKAVTGEAKDINSIGVYGIALKDNSTGVWGEGSNYDFYANGPGVNYGNGSSIRWKKNIIIIPDPLEKIKTLRGVYFDWDEAHGGQHDVGMIAEEVGKVLPEIVVYDSNGVDAEGMDYSKTTPLLLEGIKALMKEVEALKKENEQLRMEDEKLKSLLEELLKKTEN